MKYLLLLIILFPLLGYSQTKDEQINTLKYYLSEETTFEKKTIEINYNKFSDGFYINLNDKVPATNPRNIYNTSCRFKSSDIKEIGSYFQDGILIMDILFTSNKCEHTITKENNYPEARVNHLLNFSLTGITIDDKNIFEDAVRKLFNKSISMKN